MALIAHVLVSKLRRDAMLAWLDDANAAPRRGLAEIRASLMPNEPVTSAV